MVDCKVVVPVGESIPPLARLLAMTVYGLKFQSRYYSLAYNM